MPEDTSVSNMERGFVPLRPRSLFSKVLKRYTFLLMPGLHNDTLRHALKTARDQGFRYLKIRVGDERFSAVFDEVEPVDEDTFEEQSDSISHIEPSNGQLDITAPVVGYFRASSKELSEGLVLKEGDLVGEIVALGLANDVKVTSDCEVISVHVRPGDPVEFGQALATVKPK